MGLGLGLGLGLPINGWQHEQQDNPLTQLCPRSYPLSPNKHPTRRPSFTHKKLPSKEHRRSTTKQMPRKYLNHQSMKLDKKILQKYLTRQSQRSSHFMEQLDSKSHCEMRLKQNDPPDLKDIFVCLKENQDKPQGVKSELFNCPMIQRKYRRKFQAKSKLFEELPKPFNEVSFHHTRYSSKFQSKRLNLETQYKFYLEKQRQKNYPPPLDGPNKKRNSKFPIFFRELTQQDDSKSKPKQKLRRERHRQKNITQCHLNQTQQKDKMTNSSLEFTDDNIFPSRCLIRG